jgi:hypothetical protein
MDLPELWKRHQNAPFPPSALGLTVGDVKLVRLDAEVGAVLTASLRTDGIPRALPPARTAALTGGLDLVRKALKEAPLDPEAREYFGRLETLALAVLALRG